MGHRIDRHGLRQHDAETDLPEDLLPMADEPPVRFHIRRRPIQLNAAIRRKHDAVFFTRKIFRREPPIHRMFGHKAHDHAGAPWAAPLNILRGFPDQGNVADGDRPACRSRNRLPRGF